MNNLKLEHEKGIMTNEIIPIDVRKKEFDLLMNVYKKSLDKMISNLERVKKAYYEIYGYDIINNITSRIKEPQSIISKMKKKKYKMDYKTLVENVNDIAGIRVICPLKDDIYKMISIIERMPDIKIVKTKDYIKRPKASGYSGYHLIVEVPIEIEEKEIFVKVEIQLRTMAMDFWATNEHKIKYKTDKNLSRIDSKKLTIYSKILNILDDKIMKLYKKQEMKTMKVKE